MNRLASRIREAFFSEQDQRLLPHPFATIQWPMNQLPHRTTRRSLFTSAVIAVIAGVLPACFQEAKTQHPADVLLITIDTLRADALGAYGATDTLTPNIDHLAEKGVVYEAATTPMPLTQPAHASILSGLYPDQHGVLTNHQVLPDTVVTLAEMLRDAGYQTGGFTGVRFLNRKAGLAQGFDAFNGPVKKRAPRAKEVIDRAIAWLRGADPEAPLLLWVHAYDPHQPYNPPRNHRRNVDPNMEERFPDIRWKVLNRVAQENNADVPADVYRLALDYYRSEVEYTDFWVGRLLNNFDRMRPSRRSLVVLTSDHGECFENGFYFEHADCLNEEALKVPLIVRYPARAGAGARVGRRVSNLDIAPTVLQELSMPLPENLAGFPLQRHLGKDRDRFVLIRPPEPRHPDRAPSRLSIIRTVAGNPVSPRTDPRTRGVVDLMWKYLRTTDSERLFRLPDERTNRTATDSEARHRMSRALEGETLRYPAGDIAPENRDPETLEALEALGYVE
jgi:arylsulfatase A-like enzyme